MALAQGHESCPDTRIVLFPSLLCPWKRGDVLDTSPLIPQVPGELAFRGDLEIFLFRPACVSSFLCGVIRDSAEP